MAESRRYALNAQLDIEQILQEAQHRWLRPAEICAILQNHSKFRINPEPPNRPPSGSLFLFDRKVLRYFRKDGHNWRKKKDGKTVKEAHERLKAGSIDVLHCYYAHGEDNENFQRRSYWMLEEDKSHIVLVHYREVKGSRTTFNRTREANGRQIEEDVGNSEVDSSAVSVFQQYDQQLVSQLTDTSSVNGTHASDYEDAQSAYRHQSSPGFQSTYDLQSPVMKKMEAGSVPYYLNPLSSDQFSAIPNVNVGSNTQGEKDKTPITNDFSYELHQNLEFPSWENLVESTSRHQSVGFLPSLSPGQPSATSMMPRQGNEFLGQVPIGTFGKSGEIGRRSNGLEQWQASDCGSDASRWPVNKSPDDNLNSVEKTNYLPSREHLFYDLTTEVNDVNISIGLSTAYPTEQIGYNIQNNYQMQDSTARGSNLKPEPAVNLDAEDKNYQPHFRQPLLDGVKSDGLRKLDSFDRWMSKELGDVSESNTQSGLGSYWDTVGSEDGVGDSGISTEVPLDNYVLAPSLSQDQFFTILDFSPNWAYSGSEIKVLITGKFLRSQDEVEKHNWACMFGELEVPAEIVANGVIRCHTPLHEAGRVPFYVTCSNRLACSEVREFEFRPFAIQNEDLTDVGSVGSDETHLHMRFGKLLTLKPVEKVSPENFDQSNAAETSRICHKVNVLLKDDMEWEQMLNLTKHDGFSADKVKDQLLQKLLKEKLHAWLIQKVTEGGKGASVLDEGGQGVLHFAAALGYDWAIPPTIAAGVSVNFRDANGWTALHWAAYYGRERTVAFLISLDAAPGALTDPTPRYPSRTPAALASSNGHKGISGYLSEYELTFQLSTLDLKESSKESDTGNRAIETVSERIATPVRDGDLPQGLSMKDSLTAVRNATQAAARIHQVFRVQSFQRKQMKEFGDGGFGMSDERVLSSIAVKSNKAGRRDEPVHAAAVRIQNKFRSWKGRKDFILTRQRIIKIQAHVRGHQVRKNYKKIIWSVGILDKVILRWRRKGRGLSGFKPEGSTTGTSSNMQDNNTETKEDDYDFLKEGRKQTEERLNKALSRVKSMVQYPEARDQYRRLLNVVSEMQETKALHDKVLNDTEIDFDDDLIDLEALLADDTFMSM